MRDDYRGTSSGKTDIVLSYTFKTFMIKAISKYLIPKNTQTPEFVKVTAGMCEYMNERERKREKRESSKLSLGSHNMRWNRNNR